MTLGLLFSRRWLPTTFLVLVGVAVCIRLGFWQLDRLEQRRTFNAHVQEMRSLPPLNLNSLSDPSALTGMEYRTATASGKYDYTAQIALRNQYYEGQYGYHLLTPLLLDGQTAILVDRGWIPAEDSTPDAWRKYDEAEDLIVVQGILRLGHRQSFATPPPPHLDFWVFVDIERISAQMPYSLLPVYLQLDPDEKQMRPPFPYQPTLDLSEGPHLGYAIQWFTFAVILLFGYPVYVRKQEEHPSIALPSEKSNGHK